MKECHIHQTLLDFYHREAKRLHRAAQSTQKATALPVIRRLLKNRVITDISLVQVFANQNLIQRKHLFTLLAREMDYENWPALKLAIECEDNTQVHFTSKLRGLGYPNLWFASVEEATQYSRINGGEVIEISGQAIVSQQVS